MVRRLHIKVRGWIPLSISEYGRDTCARACTYVVRVRSYGTQTPYKSTGAGPPEHQLIRPCTWLKFTLKYHAWFEIRNSKFEIMNRPGESVLAKFRSLRPAEKALLSLIYILSAMTKCGPKPIFLGPIGWGPGPHWIAPKKMGFGPNFDIGEFYDRGRPCTS